MVRYEIETVLSVMSLARGLYLFVHLAGVEPDPGVLTMKALIAPLWIWGTVHIIAGALMLAMLRWRWLDDAALFLMFTSWTLAAVLYLLAAPGSPTCALVVGYAVLSGILCAWYWMGRAPGLRTARTRREDRRAA